MAVILRRNGWYTWYSEDNWIRRDYAGRIDYAGVSTIDAFNRFKRQPDSDKIITEYLNRLYGKNMV